MEKPLLAQKDHSLEKTREYLERHFKQTLPIKKLARMAGVSVSTFSRRFKKMTGLGLETYLQRRRLEEALRLLKATRLPIFRIAQNCGFKSTPYFVHLFKSKNGLPPQKFRKKSQAG
jgi:AraC family transcriptional regulator of adaptative response / methylphosphotriester-DNA alkyltransferase methyltransferase